MSAFHPYLPLAVYVRFRPIADIRRMMHQREVIGHVRHIKPIYGWGWAGPDDATRDTPEPFRLGCENPAALEGVVLADHEFSGATVHLSSRHTSPDGYYNIEIKRDAVTIARGYAEA